MKKAYILFGIIAIVALFGFSVCGKDPGGPPLYVAGEYVHAGVRKACYWVNGKFHDLHAATPAAIAS